jgi:hypothetical protein
VIYAGFDSRLDKGGGGSKAASGGKSPELEQRGPPKIVGMPSQGGDGRPARLVRVRSGWLRVQRITSLPLAVELPLMVLRQPFCNFIVATSVSYKYLGALVHRRGHFGNLMGN